MKTTCRAAAVLIAGVATQASASTTNLIGFGDSLIDSGNVAAFLSATGDALNMDVYPNGQFTNGDTFATQLGIAPSLLGGSNFAYGGAQALANEDAIPDLLEQVFAFAQSDLLFDEETVATIWVGGNDFLNLPDEASQPEIVETIERVVAKIALSVEILNQQVGVQRFLVLGLPDLGLLPEVAGDPQAAMEFSALTQFYNIGLEGSLAALDAALPAQVDFFDVDSFYQDIITMVPPELVSVPCLTDPVGCAANPENYIVYDDIHPSEWVHTLLADAIAEDLGLTEVPLPATAPFLLVGIGGLGLWARRRRSRA